MEYKCEICAKIFSNKYNLKTHITSKTHHRNLARQQAPKTKNLDGQIAYIIDLKNKAGDIIGETIVDEKSYKHITGNRYPVHNANGYARIRAGDRSYELQRYIYYIIYENKSIDNMFIDHKNNDPLDNR